VSFPVNPPPPIPDSTPGRILALDVGSRTIGLAVSDGLGITAQGLETIRRKNKRADFAALEQVLRQHCVQEIVVGYPLRMSGSEGAQSERMSAFAEDLRRHFALPVHLWDERLTSAQANRLLRETNMSIRRRAQVVDRLAAVLILQSFLDHRAAKRA
jgi:putative holliday junction resolvase